MLTPAINTMLQIFLQIFVKIWNGPNGILRGLGKTYSWNNQKSKISCKTPFKPGIYPEVQLSNRHVIVVEYKRKGRIQRKKIYVWDPMPELTITSPYVHSRVDLNTFTMGIGQPYARVDLNPMPEFSLSPSQGLWICVVFTGWKWTPIGQNWRK